MYFFSDTSRSISTSTPIGSWNLAGYQQVNVHAWVKGGAGKVYMSTSFNNLAAYMEELTIGGVGPGGWGIATLTRTYPIHAPTMSIVLYNPTTGMDFMLRLYAACCEAPGGLTARLLPWKAAAIEGDAERKLKEPIDLESLARVTDPAITGAVLAAPAGARSKGKGSTPRRPATKPRG